MKRGFKIAIVLLSILLILLIVSYGFYLLLSNFLVLSGPEKILPGKTISILSPANSSYSFNLSDFYILDLVVEANFNVSSWWYSLEDVKHELLLNDTVYFDTRAVINAVRGENKIVVYVVEEESEKIFHEEFVFYVDVPDSSPFFSGLDDSVYVCEGSALSYNFNVVDVDEEVLNLKIEPSDFFFLEPSFTKGKFNSSVELFSGVLNKNAVGEGLKIYNKNILVSDGKNVDSVFVNITVIETNNAPIIKPIGVQTVLVDSKFSSQIFAEDIEDGNHDSGNLIFEISSPKEGLISISKEGVVESSPILGQEGIYGVEVCVSDEGIKNPHSMIFSECGQNGEAIKTCEKFNLAVVKINAPPTIVDYFPKKNNLNVSGSSEIIFNITSYDPDKIVPDVYWYVGGSLQKVDYGEVHSGFLYALDCGVSGVKVVKAVITDGLLNDSIEWFVSVKKGECIPIVLGKSCEEKWGCSDWSVCQNARKSFESGILSREDYDFFAEECLDLELYEEADCGIQKRNCIDVNSCNFTKNKPVEFQSCHYTENPSCEDRIKNCHSGGCELLVDCGGPCEACPTCSDGIQNQNELGVDCGGPCGECFIVVPLFKRSEVQIGLGVIFLLIIFAIVKFRKVMEYIEKLKER